MNIALAQRRLPETVTRLVDAADTALGDADDEGWRTPIVDEVHDRVRAAGERLLAGATRGGRP